eukprot:gnl/MRDRNA2_/MRDRNA2_62296_c0_seq1.p1 gnl/MRDRNA2_/MRDRNA2_62296_c0~~gnl/MRDRNA2_/MRDRNA2_62296_c0_seq1.p1  ORF type:complete len:177 (+),score=20.37 gnl/MRDRNA2_/MRDRNA2_62296_c0_seq1:1-531(+)
MKLMDGTNQYPAACGTGAPFEQTCALLRGDQPWPRHEFNNNRIWYNYKGEKGQQGPAPTKLTKPVILARIYRLAPGSWLRPHYGTPGRLVVSIGLKGTEQRGVKEEAEGVIDASVCNSRRPHLRVAGQSLRWQRGKALIFDDSFEHDVRQPPEAPPRYVLTFSMLHPSLIPPEQPR